MINERPQKPDVVTPVRKRHRMIDRVAGILELVARNHDGLTLTELARMLDAPLSSLQGLVNGLVAAGYLDEYDRRYHLGGAPYLLNLMAGRHLVTRVGHRELEAVHADAGLTTLLSVVVGQGVFYVDSCSSTPRYDYLAKNLVRRSLIRTTFSRGIAHHKRLRRYQNHLLNFVCPYRAVSQPGANQKNYHQPK